MLETNMNKEAQWKIVPNNPKKTRKKKRDLKRNDFGTSDFLSKLVHRLPLHC